MISLLSKGLSTSLAIIENDNYHHSEMPHHTPNRTTVMFKKCKIASVGKNVKKSELLYIDGGNKKRCNCCGKQLGSFSKGYA